MPDDNRPQIAQLTSGELDRYANQFARCLKALDTRAPILAQMPTIDAELSAGHTAHLNGAALLLRLA